jgi:hypothetical protein
MPSPTDTWKAKIGQIADDLRSQGICKTEAKALERAGRDVDQALQAHDNAANGRTVNGVITVASALTVIGCASFETGVGAAACIVGGTILAVSSLDNWILGDSSTDLAAQEISDALDDLSSAIDEVCACKLKHGSENQ